MERYVIEGGAPLVGEARVSGAKNSALALLSASLMAEGQTVLRMMPELDDVEIMAEVLLALGATVEREGSILTVQADKVDNVWAPEHLVGKMRASNLILGPLLARFGEVRLPYPGGCAIGARPMDYHMQALASLGAEIADHGSYIEARCRRLTGARICFDFPSVGATENAMMAACLAEGESSIVNAAREPEIVDLARMLNLMGAKISGAGSGTIYIEGVKKLHGVEYAAMPDRIEAGTLLLATAACRGDLFLRGWDGQHCSALLSKLREAGLPVEQDAEGLRLCVSKRPLATDIRTMPYPGFPTDLQPQFMALMCQAEGICVVRECVFEDRFHHVQWLRRMGADIRVYGDCAMVRGRKELTGARLEATDLRAGAALTLAALAAEGISQVEQVQHIDRGYQNFEQTLRSLGAKIRREALQEKAPIIPAELCLV